jgi:hypothetical protein
VHGKASPESEEEKVDSQALQTVSKEQRALDAAEAFEKASKAEFIKAWAARDEVWTKEGMLGMQGLLTVVGALAMQKLWWWAFGIASVLLLLTYVVGVMVARLRRGEIARLTRERDEARHERDDALAAAEASSVALEAAATEMRSVDEQAGDLHEAIRWFLDHRLGEILTALGLGNDRRVRLSLYLRQSGEEGEEDVLVLMGRVCANPTWRSPHQRSYPLREGCLGLAWEDVTCVRRDGSQDEASRRKFHADTRFPVSKLRDLRMPTRAYLAQRLDVMKNHELGILMLESIDAGAFVEQEEQIFAELDPDRAGSHGARLVELVQVLRPSVVNVNALRGQGF